MRPSFHLLFLCLSVFLGPYRICRQVDSSFCRRGVEMLTRQCWLLYLWDLGETWFRGSECIPEQLCQVSPKSYCDFLCFWCFLWWVAEMLTLHCWLLYLWDLGETWYRGSGCIPEQLCQVSPKSYCDFLCFWCFLGQGARMLTRQCWLLYLWDLVQTWYSGSGCIPEELCQVYPKSYNAYFVFQWFLRRGAEMLTLDCWLI